jgi:biopolymer transport protein ExbB/TolQ
VEDLLLAIANALKYPVFLLAFAALAAVIFETGAFAVELLRRRRRDLPRLERAAAGAKRELVKGDKGKARVPLLRVSTDAAMAQCMRDLVAEWGQPNAQDRVAKRLADFDFNSLRRLERTRMLVRAGPGLGLMGTLIPLSPALAALGEGDVKELSDGLRVAFGVTVIGILVGMVAFMLSLVRDRLYSQDHSDLEYVAAVLFDQPDVQSQHESLPLPVVQQT